MSTTRGEPHLVRRGQDRSQRGADVAFGDSGHGPVVDVAGVEFFGDTQH